MAGMIAAHTVIMGERGPERIQTFIPDRSGSPVLIHDLRQPPAHPIEIEMEELARAVTPQPIPDVDEIRPVTPAPAVPTADEIMRQFHEDWAERTIHGPARRAEEETAAASQVQRDDEPGSPSPPPPALLPVALPPRNRCCRDCFWGCLLGVWHWKAEHSLVLICLTLFSSLVIPIAVIFGPNSHGHQSSSGSANGADSVAVGRMMANGRVAEWRAAHPKMQAALEQAMGRAAVPGP